MLNHGQLIKIIPNVALLDDDIELAQDLSSCLTHQVAITHFTTLESFTQAAKERYRLFSYYLNELFSVIAVDHSHKENIRTAFENVVANKPYSVALIDLDLGNNDATEGFKAGDYIGQFFLKPLIYSASEASEIVLEMVNQGDIYGYLNKTCDLHEELLPTIHNINNQYYQFHFNLSHLNYFFGLSTANAAFTPDPDNTQYIVYNNTFDIISI